MRADSEPKLMHFCLLLAASRRSRDRSETGLPYAVDPGHWDTDTDSTCK
jgi:hypothetical protein